MLVTAILVPTSLVLSTVMMEEIRSFDTLVLTRATWCHSPEDGILHGLFMVICLKNMDYNGVNNLIMWEWNFLVNSSYASKFSWTLYLRDVAQDCSKIILLHPSTQHILHTRTTKQPIQIFILCVLLCLDSLLLTTKSCDVKLTFSFSDKY
jgi:hypothetical protein